MTAARWLMLLGAAFLAAAVAAGTLPFVAARGQEGLAAAGAAAIVFLGFAGLAGLIGLAALVITCVRWRALSPGLRVLGLVPIVVTAGAITVIAAIATASGGDATPASPTPRPTTAAPDAAT